MAKDMMDRSETSLGVARSMIDAWRVLDWDRVANLFTDDGVLQVVPLKPYTGRAAIKAHLDQIASGIERLDFKIRHLNAIGHIVLFERSDEFVYKGRTASVPVVGVMEISDGHVKAWREYMDLATMTKAMGS
ncbi:MAG TPA: limonene-1,2-epoxide hydrolase family protein [Pseudomonadales bacterium]|jgi:limonene-1,2-epoxide hydrolase|nr:limonene-1,2-epoxide hydrolase family protein [Pseudomonadales bacterium]